MIGTLLFLLAVLVIIFPIYLMVFMSCNVLLALGMARLLFSRKLYGTSFSSNTCVMKVGFKLCAVL